MAPSFFQKTLIDGQTHISGLSRIPKTFISKEMEELMAVGIDGGGEK